MKRKILDIVLWADTDDHPKSKPAYEDTAILLCLNNIARQALFTIKML
jgi:hypothetical protein